MNTKPGNNQGPNTKIPEIPVIPPNPSNAETTTRKISTSKIETEDKPRSLDTKNPTNTNTNIIKTAPIEESLNKLKEELEPMSEYAFNYGFNYGNIKVEPFTEEETDHFNELMTEVTGYTWGTEGELQEFIEVSETWSTETPENEVDTTDNFHPSSIPFLYPEPNEEIEEGEEIEEVEEIEEGEENGEIIPVDYGLNFETTIEEAEPDSNFLTPIKFDNE